MTASRPDSAVSPSPSLGGRPRPPRSWSSGPSAAPASGSTRWDIIHSFQYPYLTQCAVGTMHYHAVYILCTYLTLIHITYLPYTYTFYIPSLQLNILHTFLTVIFFDIFFSPFTLQFSLLWRPHPRRTQTGRICFKHPSLCFQFCKHCKH